MKYSNFSLGLGLIISGSVVFSGCTTVKEYYQTVSGNLDTSLREPTGYYEHADVKNVANTMVVPSNLSTPIEDPLTKIPTPGPIGFTGPVGENMDVRAPIVPLKSNIGIHAQWADNEAIVWLEAGGAHKITDEKQAWMLIGKVLDRMKIKVGSVTQGAFELTTASADFNEFGQPYSPADASVNALRFNQIYKIRVGRSANGSIGIATSLIGSMTKLSSGKVMANILSPIELERFSMGFSNAIIQQLDSVANETHMIAQKVSVTLDRDNNNQDCLAVSAPYNVTYTALKNMLPQYSFEIKDYSISQSKFTVKYSEQDAQFFAQKGVPSFNLESDEYIIRVSYNTDEKSSITFYDKDDKPLDPLIVSKLANGFSQALIKQINADQSNGINL